MKTFNYSYTSFANIQSIVSLFSLMYSDEFKNTFAVMSNDDFDINFNELEKSEAHLFLGLINTSDLFLYNLKIYPQLGEVLPIEVVEGLNNVQNKLKPYENYLKGFFTGEMSLAEIEHKLLAWGVKQHAKQRRIKRLSTSL